MKKSKALAHSSKASPGLNPKLPSAEQLAPLVAALLPHHLPLSDELIKNTACNALDIWRHCVEELEARSGGELSPEAFHKQFADAREAFGTKYKIGRGDRTSWSEAAKLIFPASSQEEAEQMLTHDLEWFERVEGWQIKKLPETGFPTDMMIVLSANAGVAEKAARKAEADRKRKEALSLHAAEAGKESVKVRKARAAAKKKEQKKAATLRNKT